MRARYHEVYEYLEKLISDQPSHTGIFAVLSSNMIGIIVCFAFEVIMLTCMPCEHAERYLRHGSKYSLTSREGSGVIFSLGTTLYFGYSKLGQPSPRDLVSAYCSTAPSQQVKSVKGATRARISHLLCGRLYDI
jgi:hypothetical protein